MAQQTLNNGESGLVIRGKINNNFTEIYTAVVAPTVISATNPLVFTAASAVDRVQFKTMQSAAYGDYWMTLKETDFGTGPEHDHVMNWGFNTNGSGGRINTDNGAMWISMESHFNGISDDDFEFHCPEVLSRDGTQNIRVLSYNISKNFSNAQGFSKINGFEWRNFDVADETYFSISDGQVNIANTTTGGITTLFLQNGTSDTEVGIDSAGNLQVLSASNVDDVGRLIIDNYNESAKIRGSNTNSYRLIIDNSKSSTATWSGLAFQLQEVDKVYIGSAGSSYANPALANSFFIYNNAGNATNFLASSSYNFDNSITISNGKITQDCTIITAGTTGAQTINHPSGQVNFAAAASTLVVTNSLVTTSSIVWVQVLGTDVTAKTATVTKSSGSFTITLNAAATAETAVEFIVFN